MNFESLNNAVISLNDRLIHLDGLKNNPGCFPSFTRSWAESAVTRAAEKLTKILEKFKSDSETPNEIGFDSCKEYMAAIENQYNGNVATWHQSERMSEAVDRAIAKFAVKFPPNMSNYSSFAISPI